MQCHGAHDLDIEVAHFHDPLAGLTNRRKNVGNQTIKWRAVSQLRFERGCLCLQRIVG